MDSSHFTDITCPLGLGGVKIRDFCNILTLLPPGAFVFHKQMSCFCNFTNLKKLRDAEMKLPR